jgi:hypothetical protein
MNSFSYTIILYDALTGLRVYCLGIIIGLRCDLANASCMDCEVPSVRMILPIDMKKLARMLAVVSKEDEDEIGHSLPKRCR